MHCYFFLAIYPRQFVPMPCTPLLCVSTQVQKPSRDLPLGILGALGIVTACYMLMSAALVMMTPLSALDLGAPFAAAFRYGWDVHSSSCLHLLSYSASYGALLSCLYRKGRPIAI